MKTSPRLLSFLVMSLIGMSSPPATAQAVVNLAKPDSAGWIKLFRGTNTGDFFTFYNDNTRNNPFPDNTFKVSAETVTVTGSPTGHLIFKQPFSHYRVRYEQMFPDRLGNAGMLVHVQPTDPTLMGTFPRSIECQGDPGQGMAQIWCISNVWVTVRASTSGGTPQYNPTASPIVYGGRNDGARLILGLKKPALKVGEWVTVEAEVHGSDSLEHLVRGETIIKYSNPIVAPPTDPTKVEKVLKSGLIAWQSEGVPVRYRNIQIKLFPADPLYKSLYPSTRAGDYRILPRSDGKPRLHFDQGAVLILGGEKGKLSATGRSFPLPRP